MKKSVGLFQIIESACELAMEAYAGFGYDENKMHEVAVALAAKAAITHLDVLGEYSGERVYIKKNTTYRDQLIKRAFNGNNIDEVAVAFGVSRATTYRALKRKTKEPQRDLITAICDGLMRRSCGEIDLRRYNKESLSNLFEQYSNSKALQSYI